MVDSENSDNKSVCNLGNQGDERRRPALSPPPRRSQAQVRPGQHEEPETELPPQLRPLAPQPARIQLGRRQDEAEGTEGGLLATGIHSAKNLHDQEILEKFVR